MAVELARRGRNVPFAYNRKEAKDHGEGGTLVGAPVQGRVLIIDDVISAGTSVRESITMITAAGATPCRRGHRARPPGTRQRQAGRTPPYSAVQFVTRQLKLPWWPSPRWTTCCSMLQGQATTPRWPRIAAPVQAYRERYGV